ncbi:ATP-dependent helicase HrpB [Sinomonas atrocyanea]|uniref:ATP-dependent helicase HrpB n=3 Tax=Sinomonas atrocyanea TaxID=37927 RepID=UPI00114450B7|nr:ATP-dependent helicase HrpB [Sinomonas atrocyanea]
MPPFDLARIGAGLPFAGSLAELGTALADPGSAAVVQAPPGTGKTTLVPPLVANLAFAEAHDGGAPPRVVVTQPRRVAVRAAAHRLVALEGAGAHRIGYTVRGERTAGADTVVEFVTPGVLVRRLLADPGLDGVSAVVLDEVHERGLETDLLVGMLAEVRQLRGDLRLVAMSATVDAPRFARLLGGDDGPVPVVDCPSALHPLEVTWAPSDAPRLDERGVARTFLDHVADTAAAEHAAELAAGRDVDALVFLPGAREVRHVAERLRARARGTEVLELHGQVPAAEQDRAVSGRGPGDRPRIVVSTALAESSLTVPGVRLVIDSGLAREPRRDSSRGMSGLVTVSCSRASAQQRAGRAARQGPGRVVRCYDERAYAAAPAHSTPEIASADLTEAALVLACWGAPGGWGLALPDAPPRAALADALSVLAAIGAVDDAGQATALGRRLARIPADPRLARALLEGAGLVGARAAAEAVAMAARDLRPPGADLGRLLGALRSGRDPLSRAWAEEVRRFERIAREAGAGSAQGHDPSTEGHEPSTEVGAVIALAFPGSVARRVPGDREAYLLASGTRAGLPAGSSLSGHEWLAVADAARAAGRDAAGTGAAVRAAAPITRELAEAAAAHLLTDRVEAGFANGRVAARRERRLGAIQLTSTPVRPAPQEGHAAVVRALSADGLGAIGWSEGADALRRRLALLHRELGAPWPEVSEAALLARLDDWLAPEVDALARGAAARGIDLAEPLRRLLPWPEASRLAELAPERLEVPSGSRVRIEYPPVEDVAATDSTGGPGALPIVAVKLQECFGWAETPRLADGRVPVLFHLLSPAGRPLAVTADLASFWSGPYAQVRAEMRGRYPKHPWPEDPWTAVATAKTKRRLAGE